MTICSLQCLHMVIWILQRVRLCVRVRDIRGGFVEGEMGRDVSMRGLLRRHFDYGKLLSQIHHTDD